MYPQRSVMTCGLATALEPPHFNHAPVRGATHHDSEDITVLFEVSIHAPAWGATLDKVTLHLLRALFQSTHPRGVRLHPDSPPLGQMGFNPRTRVGCDRASEGRIPISMRFQSTHPRGVRRPANAPVSRASAVSIHAPAWGATIMAATLDEYGRVSIHAPAWGATPLTGLQRRAAYVSIHAPAWGATRPSSSASRRPSWFQSTHPRGVRHQEDKQGVVQR